MMQAIFGPTSDAIAIDPARFPVGGALKTRPVDARCCCSSYIGSLLTQLLVQSKRIIRHRLVRVHGP